jgi:hypothetical protein
VYSDGLGAGGPWFDSRKCNIFMFSPVSRPALEPTQSPTQWAPGALPSGVKQPGREAIHSPLTSAEVKNGGTILSVHISGIQTPVGNSGVLTREFSSVKLSTQGMRYPDSCSRWYLAVNSFTCFFT